MSPEEYQTYLDAADAVDRAQDEIDSIARTIANRLLEGEPEPAWMQIALQMYQMAKTKRATLDERRQALAPGGRQAAS